MAHIGPQYTLADELGEMTCFPVLADGNTVMIVAVAGDGTIAISTPDGSRSMDTKGKAHWHEAIKGVPATRELCIKSVAEYVMPRLINFMARLYVPNHSYVG